YTNPNFVIQNLVKGDVPLESKQLLCVLMNILQRGFPTTLSKYLQEQLGVLHEMENFEDRLLFVDSNLPVWSDTIKGDEENNYFPAKDFFEKIIPEEFEDYAF